MRITDLKTSLEQTKQMFDEYLNQQQQEKGRDSEETHRETNRMPPPSQSTMQSTKPQLVPSLNLNQVTSTSKEQVKKPVLKCNCPKRNEEELQNID